MLIDDTARASETLRNPKSLSVKIASDDFGMGSLSYLQAFPFERLKIDKCFSGGLTERGPSREIVRAIVGLGNGLTFRFGRKVSKPGNS